MLIFLNIYKTVQHVAVLTSSLDTFKVVYLLRNVTLSMYTQ